LSPNPPSLTEEEIEKFGSEDEAAYLYTFMAAMKAVTKWLADLRAMGVYDNTRIVIVSDHGTGFAKDMFEGSRMENYNPLLMVKDFNAHGPLSISETFMTNADVPAFVTRDLPDPKNPHLGTPLSRTFQESDPLPVARAVATNPSKHGPYLFNLSGVRTLIGRDIFKASSWSGWENTQ
jgi:arylsulfatase A-like enzyme